MSAPIDALCPHFCLSTMAGHRKTKLIYWCFKIVMCSIHRKNNIRNLKNISILPGSGCCFQRRSHPTTGPIRFLSPVRFLARRAKWRALKNFTSLLFPWSHQATGPVRLDTAANLWCGRMIRRTPRVPRAMPVRGPCVTRKGAVRRSYGHVKGIDKIIIGKNLARASYLAVRAPHGLFMISKPVRGL